MDSFLIQDIRTCVFLLLFFKGFFSLQLKGKEITFLDHVTGWKGSCVLLPCTYDRKDIRNFTWYYNPVYDDKESEFKGKIVYNNLKTAMVDPLFEKNVEYVGTKQGDCTILIKNLMTEHEGQYRVRLRDENDKDKWKWMSHHNITITVSDTGPSLKIEPMTPIVQESTPVTLTCSINYYCPFYEVSLTWIENVNGTVKTAVKNDTNGVSTTTSLTLRPSWTDNNKNITCLLHRGDQQTNESQTIQLNVKYAPKNVKILLSSKEFKEGESLTLECSIESSNPPINKITWHKNDRNLFQSGGTIEVSEAGKYHCEAENDVSKTQSNTVEIFMLYAPKNPRIDKPSGNIVEGSSVTMSCSTDANPQVSHYTWYKNGEQFFNDSNSYYKFSSITENDSGHYTCEAFNQLGSCSSISVEVDVMYPPRNPKIVLQPNNTNFTEETQVTFTCVVDSSNPKVHKIVWLKDNNVLSKFIEKRSIKAEDSGTYTCRAINDIGSTLSAGVFVEVFYPPKSTVITILGESVKEGKNIMLNCFSRQSKPKISSYEWFKDGKLFMTTGSKDLNMTLKWTDDGHYSCKAINYIGNDISKPVFLDVQYAPRNVTLSISPGSPVTENTNVKLTCTAQSNPQSSQYDIYRNNQNTISKTRFMDLYNIKLSDAGEYYCRATNSIGRRESERVYLYVSFGQYTIIKYASLACGSFIFLIILVILIVYFRVWKKICRKTVDGRNDSSFFVLKKSRNDQDHVGGQTPSACSSTDQLTYTTLQFPASTDGPNTHSRNQTSHEDPSSIYSVVNKSLNSPEYENIDSSKKIPEEAQDEIHYSTITNLSKDGTVHKPGAEVEYAMLRHQ